MIDWYQPFSDIKQLPLFTYNPMRMKQSIPAARVRMETPVIYFYPKEETKVSVKVSFRNGHITERFPAPGRQGVQQQGVFLSDTLGLHNNITCVAVRPTSESLFHGDHEIGIDHRGALYRLKITRQGKLILNK